MPYMKDTLSRRLDVLYLLNKVFKQAPTAQIADMGLINMSNPCRRRGDNNGGLLRRSLDMSLFRRAPQQEAHQQAHAAAPHRQTSGGLASKSNTSRSDSSSNEK